MWIYEICLLCSILIGSSAVVYYWSLIDIVKRWWLFHRFLPFDPVFISSTTWDLRGCVVPRFTAWMLIVSTLRIHKHGLGSLSQAINWALWWITPVCIFIFDFSCVQVFPHIDLSNINIELFLLFFLVSDIVYPKLYRFCVLLYQLKFDVALPDRWILRWNLRHWVLHLPLDFVLYINLFGVYNL